MTCFAAGPLSKGDELKITYGGHNLMMMRKLQEQKELLRQQREREERQRQQELESLKKELASVQEQLTRMKQKPDE